MRHSADLGDSTDPIRVPAARDLEERVPLLLLLPLALALPVLAPGAQDGGAALCACAPAVALLSAAVIRCVAALGSCHGLRAHGRIEGARVWAPQSRARRNRLLTPNLARLVRAGGTRLCQVAGLLWRHSGPVFPPMLEQPDCHGAKLAKLRRWSGARREGSLIGMPDRSAPALPTSARHVPPSEGFARRSPRSLAASLPEGGPMRPPAP